MPVNESTCQCRRPTWTNSCLTLMKVRPRLEVASEPSLPIGRRYSVPPDVPPPDIDGWVLVRLGLRKSGVKVRLEKKMNTV